MEYSDHHFFNFTSDSKLKQCENYKKITGSETSKT